MMFRYTERDDQVEVIAIGSGDDETRYCRRADPIIAQTECGLLHPGIRNSDPCQRSWQAMVLAPWKG
jgi:hypothetical protein